MFGGPHGEIEPPSVPPRVVPICSGIRLARATRTIRSRSARDDNDPSSSPRSTAPEPSGANAKCGDSSGVRADERVDRIDPCERTPHPVTERPGTVQSDLLLYRPHEIDPPREPRRIDRGDGRQQGRAAGAIITPSRRDP